MKLLFPVEDCKVSLFITYLDYEIKNKLILLENKQIWKLTAEGKIFFPSFFSDRRLLEAGILLRTVLKKSPFLASKSEGRRLLEHGR